MRRMILVLLAAMIPFGATAHAALTDNGNGTVTDSRTGLIWQQGEPGAMSWGSALSYCEGLDLGNSTSWRLPNIKELESLTDDTRWNPSIDTAKFQNALASHYWSSTSNAYSQYLAWLVPFGNGSVGLDYKNYAYYVRCVRGGQSGSFGNLNPTIAMTPMAAPAGTTFAEWGTGFTPNGTATLHFFNPAGEEILPAVTQPLDAIGHFDISYPSPLDKPVGYYKWWAVDDASGMKSNEATYTITQPGSCLDGTAIIRGKVSSSAGGPIVQGTVKAYLDDVLIASTNITPWALYSLSGLNCAAYELRVEADGYVPVVGIKKYLQSSLPVDLNITMHPMSGIPVIYVPGIMGSSTLEATWYPKLTFYEPAPQDELNLLPDNRWDDLTLWLRYNQLNRFRVIPCPWDWRMPLDQAYGLYLVPLLDKWAKESPTGKVYVVAHSMGGLLVRAYIQGPLYQKRKDIAKFAMVGTPNLGSANPYYIWEGGDPKLIDDITDGGWGKSLLNIYSNTLEQLWYTMGRTFDHGYWFNWRKVEIREFVREEGPSLLQLLHVDSILQNPDKDLVPRPVTTTGNVNIWLKDLNEDSDVNRMSKDGAGDTVETAVFAGTATDRTIGVINVKDSCSDCSRYEDGAPRGLLRRSVEWCRGDGTVPEESALFPFTEGWADLPTGANTSSAGHVDLVGAYAREICTFLNGEVCSDPYGIADMRDAGTSAPILSFVIDGEARVLVTDPAGRRAGVDPTTGARLEEIPGADFSFSSFDGALEIDPAIDGVYHVTVLGVDGRDFNLLVAYRDSAREDQVALLGYHEGQNHSFDLVVGSLAVPRITALTPVSGVTGLRADPTGDPEQTHLSWDLSNQDGVAGYNVYAADITTRHYSRIGSVPQGTSEYLTTLPWAGDAATLPTTFTVAAVKADGAESFLSDLAQNNDRDHDDLTDVREAAIGTNPLLPDTDGDGYSDGVEVQTGSDPLEPLSPPQAVPDESSTLDDMPVTIDVLANDIGAAGVTLSIGSVVQQPSHGTAVVSGTGIIYTPELYFSGVDEFTYTASDGAVTGNAATVTVTVQRNPAALIVVSPVSWDQGSRQTISWHGTVATGKVRIQLFKGGVRKATISPGTPNDGAFDWRVPPTLPVGSNYKIKVSWLGNPAVIKAWSDQFPVVAPTLTVGQPDGTGTVMKGSLQTLAWGGPVGGKVKIQLFQGLVLKKNIAAKTPNDGVFDWVVPTTLTPGDNYLVRVTWLSNKAVTSQSSPFTIVATTGALEVTQPDGVATLEQGELQQILWSGIPLTGKAKIQLYRGTALKATIALGTPNDGSFDWKVPARLIPGDYTVRVTWLSDFAFTDESASFTVVAPTMTVDQPAGGDVWDQKTTQDITWSCGKGLGNVKIELYKGAVFFRRLVASMPNTGVKTITVPAVRKMASNYRVKVTWLTNPRIFGWSSGFITVR